MSQSDTLDSLTAGNIEVESIANETVETVSSIINGLRTCGPLFSAIFSKNTNNPRADIQEIISSTKELIDEVIKNLKGQDIELDELKISGINAFCVNVSANNWMHQEEILPNLGVAISDALVTQGISSEIKVSEFENPYTQQLFTNISACAYIFSTIKKYSQLDIPDSFVAMCMADITKSTDKSVTKLEQFHIPHQDFDLIRHHITIELCNILIAIMERNIKSHIQKIKEESLTGKESTLISFSFKQTSDDFLEATNVFIDSIYKNSRIID